MRVGTFMGTRLDGLYVKGIKHHFVDVHNIMSFDCL